MPESSRVWAKRTAGASPPPPCHGAGTSGPAARPSVSGRRTHPPTCPTGPLECGPKDECKAVETLAMVKTGVRASYRTAGTQPRHTACMFQPRRMPSANGAGRPQAAQQDPKVNPRKSPKQPRSGEDQPDGGFPKTPKQTSGNFLQTVADMAHRGKPAVVTC